MALGPLSLVRPGCRGAGTAGIGEESNGAVPPDLGVAARCGRNIVAHETTIVPVGFVRGGRTELRDDDWGREQCVIELEARFGPDSVASLDSFSHLEVVFLFDRVSDSEVECGSRHPRGRIDWPRVGIFAQRAKGRPNRIGVSRCRLVRVEGTRLTVEGLDAVDGTPVIDVKPYLREFGPRGGVVQPRWATELMSGYAEAPHRGPLTPAELLAFLRDHRLAVQASTSASGPQAAVVGFAVSDRLEIVFDTLDTSRKLANLRINPRIELVVGWDQEQTAQIAGIADEPTGEDLARLKDVYFAAVPDGVERQSWKGITYVRVRLTWARYSDFRGSQARVVELTLG
jgi:tRNA (adenine37-N6)-methyltransferase